VSLTVQARLPARALRPVGRDARGCVLALVLAGGCALLPLPAAASVLSLHASTVMPGKAILAVGCLVLSALALFFTRGLGTRQAATFFLFCGAGAVLALLLPMLVGLGHDSLFVTYAQFLGVMLRILGELALLALPGFAIGALWNLRGPHYRKDDPVGRRG